MELNLELLQQLPAQDEAVNMQCALTCTYSCFSTGGETTCNVTGFIN